MKYPLTKAVMITVLSVATLIVTLAAGPAASTTPSPSRPASATLTARSEHEATRVIPAPDDSRDAILYRLSVEQRHRAWLRDVRHQAWVRSLAAYRAKLAAQEQATRAIAGVANSSGGYSDNYPPGAVHDLVVSIFSSVAGPSQVPTAVCVAYRESHFDPYAHNASSSAAGVFQWMASSWAVYSARYGYGGASVYSAVANISVAAHAVADGGWGPWGGGC